MTTDIHPTQTKVVESTLWMRERDFYIDCLRSVMIALVILHHTAITYGASGLWFYRELSFSGRSSSLILELFGATNVTVLPGQYLAREARGMNPGRGYVRIALVPEITDCVEAARRIVDFCRTWHVGRGRPSGRPSVD